ncbi:MAG: tyrosine-protein phosphatase, partial [Pseudomonadota bacterium]
MNPSLPSKQLVQVHPRLERRHERGLDRQAVVILCHPIEERLRRVFSRDTPTRETIFEAGELFERIRYPALMHCKSGADRAGIMSVLYMLLRQGADIETAMEQLSLKYLHVEAGKTGVLDAVFKAYRSFRNHTPKPFLDW